MKFRYTIIAFVIMCLLVGLLYYIKLDKEKKELATEESKKIFGADFDKFVSLRITNRNGSFLIKKFAVADKNAKEKELWGIVEPLKVNADNSVISQVTSNLEGLTFERTIDAAKDQLSGYSLEKPDLSIDVSYKNKNGAEQTKKLNFGAKNPGDTFQYIRLGEEPKVMLGSTGLDYLKEKSLKDLRNKIVVDFAKDDVEKIYAFYPGSKERFSIEKAEKGYTMSEPMKTKADESEINKFINNFIGMRAQEFPSEDYTQDQKKWGFDKPYAGIGMLLKGSKKEVKILIGKENQNKSGVYLVNPETKNVLEVPYKTKEDLTLKLSLAVNRKLSEWDQNDLKKIFFKNKKQKYDLEKINNKWVLSDKKDYADQWKVDGILAKLKNYTASEFVSVKMDKALGFGESPDLLALFIDDKNSMVDSLLFGKTVAPDKIYVRRGATSFVYKALSSTFEQVNKDLENLRNKKLAVLAKYKITGIRVMIGDSKIDFLKDDKGNWTAKTEGKVLYDLKSKTLKDDVETMLNFLVNDDKVDDYVDSYDEKSATAGSEFGLDKPQALFLVSENLGQDSTIAIGSRDQSGKQFFIKNRASHAIYKVKSDAVEPILKIFNEVKSAGK